MLANAIKKKKNILQLGIAAIAKKLEEYQSRKEAAIKGEVAMETNQPEEENIYAVKEDVSACYSNLYLLRDIL